MWQLFLWYTAPAERMDSRATLDPNRRDLLLVAVCVKAGDIIIYDFYLLPCKAGVFVKDNLVLLAVLMNQKKKKSSQGWDVKQLIMGWRYKFVNLSYHFNGAECNNGVTTPAVGPGIPARILALLKHILLPLTVGLLISHPSEKTENNNNNHNNKWGCDWCRGSAGKMVGCLLITH